MLELLLLLPSFFGRQSEEIGEDGARVVCLFLRPKEEAHRASVGGGL